jgi:3-methyladenine DNA glycosylase Tag
MEKIQTIYDRAAKRKGGKAALEAMLADADQHQRDIAKLGDDRILSEFSKRVFQSGFNWKVVENKWPDFEEAFHGFDVGRNAMISDEDLDRHLKNTGIVRHDTKILSVRDNAIFLSDLAKEHGSAARFFADWPVEDQVGLLEVMKKRGARLGGATGQYALRFLGRESFILSASVVAALIAAGVVDKAPGSKASMAAAQEAFNAWKEESGWSMTRISRVLALSADG